MISDWSWNAIGLEEIHRVTNIHAAGIWIDLGSFCSAQRLDGRYTRAGSLTMWYSHVLGVGHAQLRNPRGVVRVAKPACSGGILWLCTMIHECNLRHDAISSVLLFRSAEPAAMSLATLACLREREP